MIRFLLILTCLGFVVWCALKLSQYFILKKLNALFLKTSTPLQSETLVQCQACRTFIPASDAKRGSKDYYYCQECH